jgi:hypothetical protein
MNWQGGYVPAARAYTATGVLPERRETDSQHVGVASCFQFDLFTLIERCWFLVRRPGRGMLHRSQFHSGTNYGKQILQSGAPRIPAATGLP